MTSARIDDVDATKLIEETAVELKKIEAIKPPIWTPFVKTGMSKERPPARSDWWYIRVASILRSVEKMGVIGVSKLRTKYGGKHRRGHQPPRFEKGSGSIIRKALQQLEKAGFLEKEMKLQHKGRKMSAKGRSFLTKIAAKIYKEENKNAPQRKEEATPTVEAVEEAPQTQEQ